MVAGNPANINIQLNREMIKPTFLRADHRPPNGDV